VSALHVVGAAGLGIAIAALRMRAPALLMFVSACFAPQANPGASCGPAGACPTGLVCTFAGTCETSCGAGFVQHGDGCIDIDECMAGNDCSSDATCTNEPGTFACACKPGFAGDGRACTRVCNTVLVYDDCTAPDTDCSTIPESQFADNAAIALGIGVEYGPPNDQGTFRATFDAGGFDVLVFESSLSDVEPATADRVAQWVEGGGKAIVSFWDLDNSTTGLTIRTALRVDTTTATFTTPRDVVHDPASPVNFFDRVEQVPSPLTFKDLMGDDGDELSTTDGFIAARHTNVTGPGAIAVTREARAITLGFLPVGMVFQGPRDADGDGTPDVQELYTNLLGYLCGY
jgi:hypothetical protein